jgi:hypothetical protein
MMDDQLDDDLKNRIKEVFENFDDTSADEGWLQLRKKFPEEQSNRRVFAWIWWGAIAAVLLLFLGIGIWIYNDHMEPQKFTYKQSKINQPEKISSKKERSDTVHKTAPSRVEKLADTTNHFLAKKSNSLKGLPKINNYVSIIKGSKLHSKDIAAKKSFIPKIIADSFTTKPFIGPALQLATMAKPNEVNTKQEPAIQQITTTKPNIINANPVQVTPQSPARTMASVFAEEKNAKVQKSAEKTKNDEKRIHFGVYAATYFSYAKGSDNEVNVGAGFSSDIKISKNLKIVTGVAIAQNTLNYGGTPPVAAAALATAALGRNNFPSVASANYSSLAVVAVPSFKNYNASLVGLDIPLNLKYEFNPQKSDTYVSAGLSSGTFINESYTYQYNNPSFFNSQPQQTGSETSTKSFNNFYFAKTLNVAFGVGYPLGKNHLVIEPFLKYPLQGLGTQQIHFGAGGLNLKFNFQTSKK